MDRRAVELVEIESLNIVERVSNDFVRLSE